MTLIESTANMIGRALNRIGFLTEDQSGHYYAYGSTMEQFGDARDCDSPEEIAQFREIFETTARSEQKAPQL